MVKINILKNIKSKIKENKEKCFYLCIFISISAVLFSNVIYIGSALNENSEIIRAIVVAIATILLVYQKIRTKGSYHIIKNKLDICLIILTLSATIPLLFKTYISLYGEFNSILRYISAFSLYIIIRDLVLFDKIYKKRILNIIIIAGIMTAIIGIDDMTTKFSFDYIFKTGNLILANQEKRMFGVFTYANTFAISQAVALVIAIVNYLEENNKITKKLYLIAIFILESTFILAYSRISLILMTLILIILFFLLKEKRIKIEYFKLMIFTLIASIIYINIFTEVQETKKYLFLWIITFVESVILCIITSCTKRIDKFLEKFSIKLFLIISVIFIFIGVFLILIGLKFTAPVCLFQNTNSDDVYEYRIRNVEKNKTYNFKFDIESTSNLENNYEFIIMEQNQATTTTKEDKHILDNFNGIKEINFETTDEAFLILIYVKNTNMQENQSFIIKECQMNGKILPLKYKYMPIKLVDKIKEIKITDQSVTSRQMYWKDSIKLIIKNPILGYGGDAFNFLRQTVQEIYYETAKIHSFPLELFLENGIIGLLSYIGVIVILIIYIFQNKNKQLIEIGIILASILIILHSAMDFDMTYIYILFDFYILLGCISTEYKKYEFKFINKKSIIDVIIIVLLIINIYGNLKLKEFEDKKRWNNLVEKFLLEEDLVEQMLSYREDEKYHNYKNQLYMITLLIESEIKQGNFTHIEQLYEIIEEPYYIMDIEIGAQKLSIAEEIKQRCDEFFEMNKKEEYKQISDRLKIFIKSYTIELENAWKNNEYIAVTKEQHKKIITDLQEIRQRNQ